MPHILYMGVALWKIIGPKPFKYLLWGMDIDVTSSTRAHILCFFLIIFAVTSKCR